MLLELRRIAFKRLKVSTYSSSLLITKKPRSGSIRAL